MNLLRRAGKRMAGTVVGASQYLNSVFVAVLLAPVLPDVALDFFGAPSPHWRNPAIRAAALFVVLVACVGVYSVRRWNARRGVARAPMPELGHYQVLVQPLSRDRYDYRPASERTGDRSVPEANVDAATPELVVAVATPQIKPTNLEALRAGLALDEVECVVVAIHEPDDVKRVVPEVTDKVLAKLREHQVDPSDVCFDTTGGNVPMSLAMLRAAALYGSHCCYVSSRWDRDGRAAHTQKARSFDPAVLFGAPQ